MVRRRLDALVAACKDSVWNIPANLAYPSITTYTGDDSHGSDHDEDLSVREALFVSRFDLQNTSYVLIKPRYDTL